MPTRTKPRNREYMKAFRKTPAGKFWVRAMNLKKYNLTPDGYDAILSAQNGVCAACGQPECGHNQFGLLRLAVDHDHATGRVRGLLCMRCNRALGLLGDSVERIASLLTYRLGVS